MRYILSRVLPAILLFLSDISSGQTKREFLISCHSDELLCHNLEHGIYFLNYPIIERCFNNPVPTICHLMISENFKIRCGQSECLTEGGEFDFSIKAPAGSSPSVFSIKYECTTNNCALKGWNSFLIQKPPKSPQQHYLTVKISSTEWNIIIDNNNHRTNFKCLPPTKASSLVSSRTPWQGLSCTQQP